jgi:hypothetical protein
VAGGNDVWSGFVDFAVDCKGREHHEFENRHPFRASLSEKVCEPFPAATGQSGSTMS